MNKRNQVYIFLSSSETLASHRVCRRSLFFFFIAGTTVQVGFFHTFRKCLRGGIPTQAYSSQTRTLLANVSSIQHLSNRATINFAWNVK